MVTLHSFLQTNPWFEGDLLALHDELPKAFQDRLKDHFPRLLLRQVSGGLKNAVEELLQNSPGLKWPKHSFYGLDCLRFTRDYRSVLFCDSDLLFLKSVRAFYELNGTLVCCGDRAHYESKVREFETYRSLPEQECQGRVITNSFNSGLLLLRSHALPDNEYEAMLNGLHPSEWQNVSIAHTDQLVLNRLFEGRQSLLGPRYNYLLDCQKLLESEHNERMTDAHVLHFIGPGKPWRLEWVSELGGRDPNFLWAAKQWNDALFECLELGRRAT